MIYICDFDNAMTFKHQSMLQLWYLENFLEKYKTLTSSNKHCVISIYREDQLYLSHV